MVESKKQLKERIAELEKIVKSKDEDIQTLHLRLSGKHICTGYCKACVHGILSVDNFLGRGRVGYICALEAKCKDFKRG